MLISAVNTSLIHSFNHSFTHSVTHHSSTHSFTHSFIHSSIHSLIHPFIHSFTHSFVCLFDHLILNSFICLFTYSFVIGTIDPFMHASFHLRKVGANTTLSCIVTGLLPGLTSISLCMLCYRQLLPGLNRCWQTSHLRLWPTSCGPLLHCLTIQVCFSSTFSTFTACHRWQAHCSLLLLLRAAGSKFDDCLPCIAGTWPCGDRLLHMLPVVDT